MHKERILALADLIEKQPHTEFGASNGFYMGAWQHHCGSPSCIAGWAAHMSGEEHGVGTVFSVAKQWLGIDVTSAEELFEPEEITNWLNLTPSQAAITLRSLAETGEVDWTVAS